MDTQGRTCQRAPGRWRSRHRLCGVPQRCVLLLCCAARRGWLWMQRRTCGAARQASAPTNDVEGGGDDSPQHAVLLLLIKIEVCSSQGGEAHQDKLAPALSEGCPLRSIIQMLWPTAQAAGSCAPTPIPPLAIAVRLGAIRFWSADGEVQSLCGPGMSAAETPSLSN